MPLLIVRPKAGADATASRARDFGIDPLTLPLFQVEPLSWEVPDPAAFDAVMITSANALRFGGTGLQSLLDLPVYAVGAATAEAARNIGLYVAVTGANGAEQLLRAASDNGIKRLLWLAGEDHQNGATPQQMSIAIVPIYRSAAISPPPLLAPVITSSMLVALHSVRAAKHFAAICDAQAIERKDIALVALSFPIASAAGNGWRDIRIAGAPDDHALLCAAKSFFTNRHNAP
jgi:uroporphyrinogen-III synthase